MITIGDISVLFESVTPVEGDLLFEGHDPNDRRLGETVSVGKDAYHDARWIMVGCPQDEGVKRNRGRTGAAAGPREIRRAFYRLASPAGLRTGHLCDVGDVRVGPSLEETHATHEAVVSRILRDGKRAIVLGGGNDISYPDCVALSRVTKELVAFNIDSHFDVREGDQRHSGTPYRQLLDERILDPTNFYEMASIPGANSPVYEEYLNRLGVNVYPLEAMRAHGIEQLLEQVLGETDGDALFWGFDLDAVRSMDAPGVSASSPLGLTAEEICLIGRIAGADLRTRIIEITEMNPKHDLDERTAKLAALILWYFLQAVVD